MKRLPRMTGAVAEKHMLSNVLPGGNAVTVEELTPESNAATKDLAALDGVGFTYAVVFQKSLFTVLSNAEKHVPATTNVRIVRNLCIHRSL